MNSMSAQAASNSFGFYLKQQLFLSLVSTANFSSPDKPLLIGSILQKVSRFLISLYISNFLSPGENLALFFVFKLAAVKGVITAFLAQQLPVCALFDDLTVVNHQDQVGVFDR